MLIVVQSRNNRNNLPTLIKQLCNIIIVLLFDSPWFLKIASNTCINNTFLVTFQPTATMKDVILAIRADEAHHRVVNHTLASMKKDDFTIPARRVDS